jgi:hypothetical protein
MKNAYVRASDTSICALIDGAQVSDKRANVVLGIVGRFNSAMRVNTPVHNKREKVRAGTAQNGCVMNRYFHTFSNFLSVTSSPTKDGKTSCDVLAALAHVFPGKVSVVR